MSELATSPEAPGYDSPVVLGGLLAAFFFPLFTLIAALVMQGDERNPVKRGQLRSWAWMSAAWLAVHVLMVVVLFAVFFTAVNSFHPGP